MLKPSSIQTSPLREEFAKAGAEFAVRYQNEIATQVTGLAREYQSIRQHVGISDFSDVGKLRVSGEGACELLENLLTGNLRNMAENTLRSMLALDDMGDIVAEVLVANGLDEYVLHTDSASAAPLVELLRESADDRVKIEDVTGDEAVLRIDGFEAADVPRQLLGLEAAGLRLLAFSDCLLDGIPVRVARLGSTGEFGYQFTTRREFVPELFDRLRRVLPDAPLCGRIVFDLLHLEMRSFNRWRDLPFGESCLWAGLHWMIDFQKTDFKGRNKLLSIKSNLERRMICVRMMAGSPTPNVGDEVSLDGNIVGYMANAAFSPTLCCPIALAYLDSRVAAVGIQVSIGASHGITVSAPFVQTFSNTVRAG